MQPVSPVPQRLPAEGASFSVSADPISESMVQLIHHIPDLLHEEVSLRQPQTRDITAESLPSMAKVRELAARRFHVDMTNNLILKFERIEKRSKELLTDPNMLKNRKKKFEKWNRLLDSYGEQLSQGLPKGSLPEETRSSILNLKNDEIKQLKEELLRIEKQLDYESTIRKTFTAKHQVRFSERGIVPEVRGDLILQDQRDQLKYTVQVGDRHYSVPSQFLKDIQRGVFLNGVDLRVEGLPAQSIIAKLIVDLKNKGIPDEMIERVFFLANQTTAQPLLRTVTHLYDPQTLRETVVRTSENKMNIKLDSSNKLSVEVSFNYTIHPISDIERVSTQGKARLEVMDLSNRQADRADSLIEIAQT